MNLDFNSILEEVGSFGPYQIYLCIFLVTPSAFICALLYFTQYFIILVPPHHCSTKSGNSSDLKDYIPHEIRNGKIVYNSCYLYERHNFTDGSYFVSNTSLQKCTNGWSYDYSSLYPTMATESNWVCDDDRQPYNVQTIFFVGTSIGCLLFGYISDKYGRKPSIIASTLLASIAGIGTAFAFDFWSFTVLRFLVGMTIIPLSEDPYVLSLEYIGVEKRTFSIVAWTFGYISASLLCPWIAYALQNWRILCFVTSVPLLIVIIGLKLIPESASWLITQGKTGLAMKYLEKVAKTNKKKNINELNTPFIHLMNDSINNSIKSEFKEISALNIFKLKRMRIRTIILSISWFILFTCYHTNTQNSSNLGSDIYTSFTFGALMEIPATVFVYLALDRLGRRWPMAFSMLVSGFAGLSTLLLNEDQNSTNLYLMATLVMRVSLATEYNIIIQYSTEVYPTVLRGRALAFLRFMGTLGLYLSPSIVYLSIKAFWLPLVITGLMSIIASILLIFLPETMNHNLPHTLEDGENFGQNQRILDFPCFTTNHFNN